MPHALTRPLTSPSITWSFKVRTPERPLSEDLSAPEGWHPASVPGTVHTDLLAAGLIPDPFYGQHEAQLQWVGTCDWLYRADFTLDAADLAWPHADLHFGGLDTVAEVWLNGEPILRSENMFVPARVAVAALLRGGTNTLWIRFASALHHGQTIQAQHGKMAVWNGDPSRVYVRKAQYHYGWDWGPVLLTAGVWQDVSLQLYATRIEDVQVTVHLPPSLPDAADIAADIKVRVELAGRETGVTLRARLIGPDGDGVHLRQTGPGVLGGRIEQAQLWWPAGYGAQALYTLEVMAMSGADSEPFDQVTRRIGLRRLELVQENLAGEAGQSFFFRVNDVDIFCGGVNWIPDDLFMPRVTPQRYRQRLQATADAHMVMVRVWGGGIYEQDVFYDLCDELGLLVWQDFMFACGLYPAYPAFLDSVAAEARSALRRLRHHPSLALWCGNNEDYQLAQAQEIWGHAQAGNTPDTAFPAQTIYEKLLPAIVRDLDPQRPYVPGSAWSPGDVHDQQRGDRHTWEVWGQGADYRLYPSLGGRFVSEFGMCSAPAPETVEACCPPGERHSHAETFMAHNRASDGPAKLDAYLARHYGEADTLAEFIYGTQLVQADALSLAVAAWRGEWGQAGDRRCGGALVWQLNDCWPVSSWALIDSLGHAKPAYYALRRALAPLSVGLARDGDQWRAWVVSARAAVVRAELHLESFTLDGAPLADRRWERDIAANAPTPLGVFYAGLERQVTFLRLLVGGQEVSRCALWPEAPLPARQADPQLLISRDGNQITLRSHRPVRGIWLSTVAPTVWSDNWLELRPGELGRVQGPPSETPFFWQVVGQPERKSSPAEDVQSGQLAWQGRS